MRLLAKLIRPFTSPPSDVAEADRKGSVARRAVVEWKDSAGAQLSQKALIQTDREGKPRILVKMPIPFGLAQIRDTSSVYSVEVLSAISCNGGFELKLNYIGTGRRREDRMRAGGPALLEAETLPATRVEVLDVSGGGMQVFCVRPLKSGATVRVSGKRTEHVGIVRHCRTAKGGFRIGIQLFGENRRETE